METPAASRDAVLEHLEKLLASETFSAASRSRILLRFLVEQAVDNQSDRLKEYTVGAEALGKGEAFDPRTDPIVRAEASRLRSRLERYYATEGASDKVLVSLPKGSYVPRFRTRTVETSQPPPGASGRGKGPVALQRVAWFALGALTVAVAVASLGWVLGRGAPPMERVVPLTALPGVVWWPTFSPDARYVAFVWTGEKQARNMDIYVKIVGSSELRRITSDPAVDFGPSWSPDGRQIAFVRSIHANPGAIHLVSPLGGSGRKLSDWPALGAPFGGLSWSPDGRFLAAARAGSAQETAPLAWSIYLIPVEGGEPRPLTRAQPGGRDFAPALSPDGRHLAYAACATRRLSPCDVQVLDLDDGFAPTGSVRRITRQGLYLLSGLAWTPDGKSLVYGSEAGPETSYLWRVAVDGTKAPERVEVAGVGAQHPAISGERLAFMRWLSDADIVRFEPGLPHDVFLASSYWDGSSHFSPDGQRIAFESMRSGERQEIWLATADGRDPTQLTHGPGRLQGSPAWSPDGQRIVFDSQGVDGHWDIWTIELAGGAPRRLTQHPGDENVPRWSRDGRWVYFSAQRDGKAGIWRIPADGGVEERVVELENGTGVSEESADGRTLYFTTGAVRPLFAHPLDGGSDRKLVDCVGGFRAFVVAERGVYYADCGAAPQEPGPPEPRLRRLDVPSGDDRILGTLQRFRGSLTVSPDETTILYTSVTRTGSDLMLVEGYR